MYRLVRKMVRQTKKLFRYALPMMCFTLVMLLVTREQPVTIQRVVWETYNSTDAQHIIGKQQDGVAPHTSGSKEVKNRTKSNPPDTSSDVKKVIIQAYWRGGATFIGSLFEHYQRSFYLFEPLTGYRTFGRDRNVTVHNLDGSKRSLIYPGDLTRKTMTAFMDCKLNSLDIETLMHPHMKYSTATKDFFLCIGKNQTLRDIKKCLPALTARCEASKLIVGKVVRMNMTEVVELLSQHPDYKAIHFVRDPRAVFSSRYKWHGRQSIGEISMQDTCNYLKNNHDIAMEYMKKNPRRIIEVRYEDLALRPLKFAKEIYDFLGLDFPEREIQFIRNQTSYKGENEGCYLCTLKKNSAQTAFDWRTKLPQEDFTKVDKYCADTVYGRYGYIKVPFDKLKNFNVSVIEDRP